MVKEGPCDIDFIVIGKKGRPWRMEEIKQRSQKYSE